jgi:hypothetical protein
MATLPPPKTTTFLPCLVGVSYFGNSLAFIRFTRVRYSFAKNTFGRFSPGMFRNFGRPAPVPMKIASKPVVEELLRRVRDGP